MQINKAFISKLKAVECLLLDLWHSLSANKDSITNDTIIQYLMHDFSIMEGMTKLMSNNIKRTRKTIVNHSPAF